MAGTAAGGTAAGGTASGGAGAGSGNGGAGAGKGATGGASSGGTSALGGAAAGGIGNAGGDAAGGTPPATGGAAGTSSAGAAGSAMGGGAGSPIECNATVLKDAGACTERLIGVALTTRHLGEAAYVNAAKEFSYVTAEDEMKWDATEPSRNGFTYGAADQVVDFAMSNGMKVKGHTLVWYNQLPSWVSSIDDESELRSVMTNHITKVMQHFKGKVMAWDVVNEAWDPGEPTELRDSVFTRVLGRSYIDDAFTAARAADPDAKLYYNDYGTDGMSVKANSVYEMVRDMKERGIPIDGVGLQMHWRSVGSTLTAVEVVQNIQRLGALGLEVVISEMDVQLCRGGTLEDQQVRYHDIVAACVSQPNCSAVTFWGITDKYSWLNNLDLGCSAGEEPRGLLWDDDYTKKLAYTGVLDALSGR
jgi:endo-1,4-beta-xylanase